MHVIEVVFTGIVMCFVTAVGARDLRSIGSSINPFLTDLTERTSSVANGGYSVENFLRPRTCLVLVFRSCADAGDHRVQTLATSSAQ